MYQVIVETIIKAYKEVYGEAKWNGLTEKEQHDVIMTMATDFLKAINNSKGE